MSKQQAWIFIVIAAVAVGALVHMNRYEFLGRKLPSGYPYLIRIDHLTGQPCVASVSALDDYDYEEFLEVVNMPLC